MLVAWAFFHVEVRSFSRVSRRTAGISEWWNKIQHAGNFFTFFSKWHETQEVKVCGMCGILYDSVVPIFHRPWVLSVVRSWPDNFAASIRPFPRCGEDDFFEWLLATSNNFGCFTRIGFGVPRDTPQKHHAVKQREPAFQLCEQIAFQEIHQEPLSRKDIQRSLQIFGEIAKLATLQKNMWLFLGDRVNIEVAPYSCSNFLYFFSTCLHFSRENHFPTRNLGISWESTKTTPNNASGNKAAFY